MNIVYTIVLMDCKHLLHNDLDDLMQGYSFSRESKTWSCLYCASAWEEGLVYPAAGGQALAERAAQAHVDAAHGGAFAALIARGNSGLPDVQEKVLRFLYEGKSDAEIAQGLGGKSPSTVRNHRFALRKRESEARALLALMSLLEGKRPGTPRFVEYPGTITVGDERIMASEKEAAVIEGKYSRTLPDTGFTLVGWPKKQKDKLILLKKIAELFSAGARYTEREVNDILIGVWADYVTIRRYLIEYRFLDRKPDGSEYWKP
jgi:DNA-binding CsgD family transcriptional regulator